MRLAVVASVLLALAGCLEHTSAHAAAVPTVSETSPIPSAPSTSLSDARRPIASSMNQSVQTSISREGETWSIACAHVLSVFHCEALQEGSPLTEPLVFPGEAVSLNATLSWTAASPLHEELAVGLVDMDEPGPPPVFAEGPSPLRLDWDLRPFAGRNLGLHIIYYSNVDAGPANVAASLQQPWTLTGDVWSVV